MHAGTRRNVVRDDREVAGATPVRIVLVGQTGLDLLLRLDPSIELRRAPSAVHAIAEAADPMGAGSADAVTLILSPETDPKGDVEEFRRNLELVCPGARVLRLLAPDEAAENRSGADHYDGTIGFGTPPEEIRRIVREVHVKSGRERGEERAGEEAPENMASLRATIAAEVVLDGPGGREGGAGGIPETTGASTTDEGLVQAVLLGRDVVLPALDLIRRRLGRADVSFVRGEGDQGVAVENQGVSFGRLVSPSTPGAVLSEQARWLGYWMALKQQQEELRLAAFTDELTGAWNRRYCERYLGSALAQAAATRGSVTVLYFDLDNFKLYNDRYGHAAGDQILRETVRLLQSVIRPTDRVCRIGGDEFVVVFHEPTGPRAPGSKPPAGIGEIAKRFQRQICEHRFPKLAEEAPGTLTVSGGLATFPWDGRTTQELIDRADQLAIQSKLQGKNVIRLGPGAIRVCGTDGAGTVSG